MSATPFAEVLAALTRQRGVLGSMVVSEADGIVVDSNLQIGVKGNVVAALAASLYRKARLSAGAAGKARAHLRDRARRPAAGDGRGIAGERRAHSRRDAARDAGARSMSGKGVR